MGAGPNGLAAAIELARAGLSVRVLEAADTVGGGARSAELTLPGFVHDVCSAIHPLGVASPFFRTLPLAEHGVEWIEPPAALAHPFDDGTAVLLERSPEAAAPDLGADDERWRRLFAPLVRDAEPLLEDLLGPLHVPAHPIALARFGARAAPPATTLARLSFRGEKARGVFAGLAAHSMLRLDRPPSAAFGLTLGLLAHAVGWPFPRGGSQRVSDALASYLRALGGEIETGRRVESIAELGDARAVLLDVTPRGLLDLAGDRLPDRYRRGLERYRYGPGVFKLDYALAEPVPWAAAVARRAGTVHLGPSMGEIGNALRAVRRGTAPDPPFLIAAQPSLADDTRAPDGRHVLWVYCHVPNGWAGDHTEAIEDQIERFAPGFRDIVLARTATGPTQLAARNPNLVGGDIAGGPSDGLHLIFRPTFSPVPYATPDPAVFLCSSATPPGPGVHGMCGYHAAMLALRRVFGG